MQNNLTSLNNAKAWAGVTTPNDDPLLARLIQDVSRFILAYIQRPTLFKNIFSDVYDGVGQRSQVLRHWPVQSVSLVQVDGVTIPPAGTPPGCGYILDPWDGLAPGRAQRVSLRGYSFCRGYSNVSITYTAGFFITGEPQQVPAGPGPYNLTVNAPHGAWAVDHGVTYANGTALTLVTGAPSTGQYGVVNGMYSFAAGDAGQAVLISYSYVPADIDRACVEMVAERYRYRSRIGEVSRSLGGQETASFSQKDMPDFIRTLLQSYRRVVLV